MSKPDGLLHYTLYEGLDTPVLDLRVVLRDGVCVVDVPVGGFGLNTTAGSVFVDVGHARQYLFEPMATLRWPSCDHQARNAFVVSGDWWDFEFSYGDKRIVCNGHRRYPDRYHDVMYCVRLCVMALVSGDVPFSFDDVSFSTWKHLCAHTRPTCDGDGLSRSQRLRKCLGRVRRYGDISMLWKKSI